MTELNKKTLTELSGLLAQRACSSLEIVEDILSAIESREGEIGAYLHIDAAGARSQAKAADGVRADGRAGPLTGIPLAVKDLLNVRGDPCGCASRILQGYIAPYDATVVALLRAAGMVFLGRTNMDEFAMGSSTENSAFKVTRNPWDVQRVPGGSSGGSAAAVAAEMAVAALGTDTGGSIRQPAAFCGCVGLKPTYGRVSRYGLTAFASSLDQIGSLTRTVRDAAMILDVMGRHDSRDSTSLNVPASAAVAALDAAEDLKGLRIGIPRGLPLEGLDPEVEAAVSAAVARCEELGAVIVEVELPHLQYAIACYYIIATAEASANLARFDGVRYGMRVDGEGPVDLYCKTRAAGFGPEVKRRIILGTYVLSRGYYDAYYLRAQKVRTLIREDFSNAFKQCDALLMPATPTPAYLLGEKLADPLRMYLDDMLTAPVNLAGICALSVPCGFSAAGLPLGLQVIGPALGEDTVLRVGHVYEQSCSWREKAEIKRSAM